MDMSRLLSVTGTHWVQRAGTPMVGAVRAASQAINRGSSDTFAACVHVRAGWSRRSAWPSRSARRRRSRARPTRPRRGSRRDRRPVLPARRQRRHRRPALRRPRPLRLRTGLLTGRTTLTVRATQDLSRFNLDFLLRVTQVRVDGRTASFDRRNRHELRITPAAAVAAGQVLTVEVRYAGRPAEASYRGERNWLADAREVVTMNEPHMAPWWFPANDHPRDKATMDVRITVPRQRKVISNGSQVDRVVKGAARHDPLAVQRADGALPRVLRGRGLRRPQGLAGRAAVRRRGVRAAAAPVRRASMKVMLRARRSPPGSRPRSAPTRSRAPAASSPA